MEAILEAVSRDTFGKNEARRTRRQGMVPAVLYGASSDAKQKTEATPIAVNPKALLKILHSESGANTLISLKLAGAGARVHPAATPATARIAAKRERAVIGEPSVSKAYKR